MVDEKNYNKMVKERLHNIRKEHGLTQIEMAKKLGITVQHYQRVEGAENTVPTLKFLYKICNEFSLHISYFFTGEDVNVIDDEGNVLASHFDEDGIVALRTLDDLPVEKRKDIQDYIFYKKFQLSQEEEKGGKDTRNKDGE